MVNSSIGGLIAYRAILSGLVIMFLFINIINLFSYIIFISYFLYRLFMLFKWSNKTQRSILQLIYSIKINYNTYTTDFLAIRKSYNTMKPYAYKVDI